MPEYIVGIRFEVEELDGDLLEEVALTIEDSVVDTFDAHQANYKITKRVASKVHEIGPNNQSSAIRKGSQRHTILKIVAGAGAYGVTRDEILAKAQQLKKGIDKQTLQTRVWELGPKKSGYIEPKGHRQNASGSYAEVLVATEKGNMALDEI